MNSAQYLRRKNAGDYLKTKYGFGSPFGRERRTSFGELLVSQVGRLIHAAPPLLGDVQDQSARG
jgi:hypothetical protein